MLETEGPGFDGVNGDGGIWLSYCCKDDLWWVGESSWRETSTRRSGVGKEGGDRLLEGEGEKRVVANVKGKHYWVTRLTRLTTKGKRNENEQ